jgi:hypothetical protein
MIIFVFLKSLFVEAEFPVGGRVNAIRHGQIERSDGYVIARTRNGVLVEWPDGGASLVCASDLTLIG